MEQIGDDITKAHRTKPNSYYSQCGGQPEVIFDPGTTPAYVMGTNSLVYASNGVFRFWLP